ncbi:MAG: DNA-formamidopyrimidine glycosylase family protein [Bdellovibrionota bacterium]
MPELPEVETFRRQIADIVDGKKIEDVVVNKDPIVFANVSPAKIKKALLGAKVKCCRRKGKYLWLELDRKPWLILHFGMSGSLEVFEDLPEKQVKYLKLVLVTSKGVVALRDPRRFARIKLAMDPINEKPISSLGFDPLEDFPAAQVLSGILEKRKAPVKAVLLDQSIFAGVGNWMADEILFQARINPHRFAKDLSKAEVKILRSKLLSVVETAVDTGANYDDFPENWLFNHRWGKKAGEVSSGHSIVHDTIGGRTTAWVPDLQK